MQLLFNQPQRQSKVGIIVMFANTFYHIIKAFWFLIVIWVFRADALKAIYFTLGFLVIVIVVGIVAYLRYINFTFYIDDEKEEFIINEGVFNKTRTIIQLNKIQQVNINQSLIQRLIGVYGLDVDTSGNDKKEGNIKAIDHQLAVALKDKLLENEKKVDLQATTDYKNEVIEETETQTFFKISPISLLKVGITSNYLKSIGLLLTFFFTIYENIQHFGEEQIVDTNKIDTFIEKSNSVTTIVVLTLIILTSVFLINLLRTLVKYFNYSIIKQKGSLLLSYGLISTKSTILKPEKVQQVIVSQNYFQKKLNVLELKIKQASSKEMKEIDSQIEIPGCNGDESDNVLRLIFNQLPHKGIMLTPNFRKLVFSIFLFVFIPLLGYYLFAHYIVNTAFQHEKLAYLYTILVLLLLFFGFKNYRLYINELHIIKKSGVWDISHEILTVEKIQSISTSQLFWHKGLDIGSLKIYTAGGNLTFFLGNFTVINNYVNLWLYKIENSDSNWM
jgi:putative membrane protein